jgi:Kef-type K+ transport system membrane component KefB
MVQLDSIGQLGVELFLFVLGLELDLGLFYTGATGYQAATVALVSLLAITIACVTIASFYAMAMSDALIVGGCLAISSTPVALGALQTGELREPHGEPASTICQYHMAYGM